MSTLTLIKSKDKSLHERWYDGRNLGDWPCPSRIILIGRPDSGKSTLISNIILKARPPYKKIFLSHPTLIKNDDDEDDTDDVVEEYKHIDYIPLAELPHPKYFDNGCSKQLYVLDDCDLKNLSREQAKFLGKIVSYSSTHYNLTVIISSQNPFSQLPPSLLRFSNVFCFFRYNDLSFIKTIFNRIGISKKNVDKLLNELSSYGTHDFLCVDYTLDSPCRFRKNIYIPIKGIIE